MAIADGTALYRVWGDADLLLYIGVSDRFGTRWKEHAKQQPWWGEMRRLSVDSWHESRDEAEAAEQAAIKAEFPKYNVVHAISAGGRQDPPLSTEQSGVIRETAHSVLPQLLQTYPYAEARETAWAKICGRPPESGRSTAAAQIRQQAILYDGRHRFEFLLAEAALRVRPASKQVMLGQLDRLLSLMDLDHVSIRVVPFGVVAPVVYPFVLTDGPVLRVQMHFGDQVECGPKAERAVRYYDSIAEKAVTGRDVRRLISVAAAELRGDGPEGADGKRKRRLPESTGRLF
jgi:hypothetical protein